MRIGDRIKELRTTYGITQVQLAEEAGISRSVISQYESNLVEPTATVVAKLALALNTSTDYLLGLEDDFGIKVDSKELIKRPDYDITDKQLTDFMKLFKVMTEVQKAQVLGFVIGMLENAGVNVKAVLGY